MFCVFACIPLLAANLPDVVHVVLEARYRTEIASEVTSSVTQIDKRMGDTFRENDVLMRLDDRIYAAALDKAKAKVEEADAKYRAAKRLFTDKVIASAELAAGKAQYTQAVADLVQAEKVYKACNLEAPYNGKVQQVFVQLFERVEPGQKLIEILDDSVLLARFLVPADSYSSHDASDTLQMRIKETGNIKVASIVRTAPAIDPASSLLKVEAEIDNSDGALRSGMTATLQLPHVNKAP